MTVSSNIPAFRARCEQLRATIAFADHAISRSVKDRDRAQAELDLIEAEIHRLTQPKED